MSKRGKIRLWAFGCAAVAVLGGFWLDTSLSLRAGGRQLEYVYRRALGDLAGYVQGMGSTLEKAQYAATPAMHAQLSAQLLGQSGGAKAALSSLPFSQEKTDRISRFLSQAGDYALALSRKVLKGGALEEGDMEGLVSLQSYAGKLAAALGDIQARLTAEGASIHQMESLLNNVDGMDGLALLDDDLDEVAKEFAGFPALLYDGPFSDHIPQREPLYLQGREKVTQEEAAGIAADFLGCEAQGLAFAGEGGGSLPVYSFTCGDAQVNVTTLGGEIAYYKKESHEAASLTYQQALKAAKDALGGLGLPALKESYYVINDGLCTVNFHTLAEVEGRQVMCYPDLIKVVVELHEGGMVEYDAAGFLMNHRDRDLPTPTLTPKEAAASISPLLTPGKPGLALVPTPGQDEVLCWEFKSTAQDGTQVLSYINAQSGQEEQLFLLRSDEHGTLAV